MKGRNRELYVFLLIGAVTAACVLVSVLVIGIASASKNGGFYYSYRGIDTPLRLLFHGYLGLFFRINTFGFLSWIAVPCLIYIFFTLRRRASWEIAVAAVYFLSVLVVGIKGFYNARYAFSIFPLSVTLVLLFIHDLIREKTVQVRAAVYLALSLIVIVNVFANVPQYRKYLSTITGDGSPINRGIYDFINGVNRKASGNVNFLVINQPDFYYYSGARGYTYKDNVFTGVRGLYTEEGILDIFSGRTAEEAFGIMKEKYNIGYIYINERKRQNFHEIDDIIRHGCSLVFSDESSMSVYRMEDYFDPVKEIESLEPVYTDDFSAWTGLPAHMTASEYREFDFPLKVSGIRGEFDITLKQENGDRYLVISPHELSDTSERVLQFTYSFEKGEDRAIQAKSGDFFVTSIAMRQWTQGDGKEQGDGEKAELSVFIQDFSGNWERESLAADPKADWNNYVVYKRIRAGSETVITGIYFVPVDPYQSIGIREPAVYVVPTDARK